MANPRMERETEIVRVENGGGAGGYVVLCDHASNRVPGWVRPLGLAPAEMTRHIAWDPGALPVARAMARMLDAPLLYPDASRLVIDCNRPLSAADSIAARSEDTEIPGNRDLDEAERSERVERIYEPYHRAITDLLDERADRPGLIAVHSFTPVYLGRARPWHVGLVVDADRRLAAPLLAALRADSSLEVGENEPYAPSDGVYHTLEHHAAARGLPAVMIEIRNDLVASAPGQEAWAWRLAGALAGAAGLEQIHA